MLGVIFKSRGREPIQSVEAIPREVLMCHAEDGSVSIWDWLSGLDVKARARVWVRIDNIEDGNFGDVEPIGDGLSELRIHFGPGYRAYFGQRGNVIHLINGGV
jgi:putative addiction module killer protein